MAAMKPRHVAALGLVVSYLMTPPLSHVHIGSYPCPSAIVIKSTCELRAIQARISFNRARAAVARRGPRQP